jgi:hypothetical protein
LFKGFAYSTALTCLFTYSFILTSCSTPRGGVTTEELMRPISVLHRAVNSVMNGGIKSRSVNSRTYLSQFHAVGMDLNAGYKKKKERGQLEITILGDRRPYNINIIYRIESLVGSKFVFSRYDKSLASQYLSKLNEYLASRPEERDVIDGFKPY